MPIACGSMPSSRQAVTVRPLCRLRDDGTVPDAFASRFAVARSGPGPLVWGLDPSAALLKALGFWSIGRQAP
jgi:hypothetical protein